MLAYALQKHEARVGESLPDAYDHGSIVDRVADAIAAARCAAGYGEFEVDFDSLWELPLPFVKTDDSFDAQFLNGDRIHEVLFYSWWVQTVEYLR